MTATTLTTTELDILVEGIATRVYGPLDPDDGDGWLDPIYAFVEPLLANGVAPNAADLATAWQFLCEEDAGTAAMSSTTEQAPADVRLTTLQKKVLRWVQAHPGTKVADMYGPLKHRPYYLLNALHCLHQLRWVEPDREDWYTYETQWTARA